MKKLTQKQLINLLKTKAVLGSNFINIKTQTLVNLTGGKSNPQQDRVTKKNESVVMVFQNKKQNAYDNMVKRRLEQEGKDPESFVLGPRKWGNRLQGCPLVEHKGQYYLEVIYINSPNFVEYYLDGNPIKKENIIGLPERKEDNGQAGLDNKVVIRTYKLSSIIQMTLNKEIYEIENKFMDLVNFSNER